MPPADAALAANSTAAPAIKAVLRNLFIVDLLFFAGGTRPRAQLVKGKSTTEQVRSGNSAACEGKSRHAVHLAFIAYCAREICEIRLPSPAVRLGPIAG